VAQAIVDDLDGKAGATVFRFSVADQQFEIDLTDSNQQMFWEAVRRFTDKARKVSGKGGTRKRRSAKPAQPGKQSAARAWAKANGHTVPERGRLPKAVQEAYERAHAA